MDVAIIYAAIVDAAVGAVGHPVVPVRCDDAPDPVGAAAEAIAVAD